MKKAICINVEMDTWIVAKSKVDNISRYLNECLSGLSGKTEEDTTKEQAELELKTIKNQMQELSIRQSILQELVKDIEARQVLKAKETLETDQFKRWNCGVCHHLNFMESIRCDGCGMPTREDKKTVIVNNKGD